MREIVCARTRIYDFQQTTRVAQIRNRKSSVLSSNRRLCGHEYNDTLSIVTCRAGVIESAERARENVNEDIIQPIVANRQMVRDTRCCYTRMTAFYIVFRYSCAACGLVVLPDACELGALRADLLLPTPNFVHLPPPTKSCIASQFGN